MAATYWSPTETQALLAVWSDKAVQDDLDGATRNERVFRDISSKLEEMGISRSYKQCREKIKKLKAQYKNIVDHNRSGSNRTKFRWFDMMDAVLGGKSPTTGGRRIESDNVLPLFETVVQEEQAGPGSSCRRTSPHSHKAVGAEVTCTIIPSPNDLPPEESLCLPPLRCSTPQHRSHNVPLSSLRLCVPPLRLLSAFMWQVAEQRRVKYYNRLEEFVSVVLEMVPDLLSAKERAELLLGLRARFILELCRDTPSVKLNIMQPHLDRLRMIAETASIDRSGDPMVDVAVRNFVDLIQIILKSPQEKKRYFQDIYPLHYGAKYDTALQSLVWEFLCRLEELLPVPSFHQAASWFDEDPLHLEDSLQMEPKKVQNLLQYVKTFGHLDPGSSSSPITPNTILSTMSVSMTPLLRPHEQTDSEKRVSTSHETQISVNKGDRHGDMDEDMDGWMMDDEDRGGDVDEDIQKYLNDEDPRRDMDEKHLKEQKVEKPELNGYRSESQESTDNSRSEKGAPRSSRSGPGVSPPRSSPLETASKRISTAVSSASEPLEHVCSECGKAFFSKPGLIGHKQSHKAKKLVTDTHKNEGSHLCTFCGIGFKTKFDLKKHLTTHTGERPYLCSYCGKTFKCRTTLVYHIRVHTGERPYGCPVCGKRFIQHSILVAHKRLHTGERPYKCSFCGKGFPASGALLVHTRLHTGECPFKCEFCGKGFRMSCHLTAHRRSHTKEKPYACTLCDKRYSTHKGLTYHMQTHTGEKPYECSNCGKRFPTAGKLKIHQRVHT
ncbi:zinc finger protein 527-like isoform X2 [Clupea harengus]|uniref:Zinc finger protein 527-like isoform X2 n=1 Tax=Clupea harengus TaxID=7950 RepID=A0A6P8FDD1_CLUHA|nr:zinc finger protein 527-like isoform X2 [Clupea harengus]